MNWKASLTGAVAVIVVGFIVGIVVGGKTKTKRIAGTVSTITKITTSTVTVPTTTGAGTTSATGTTGTGTPTVAVNNGQEFYSAYLASQDTGQLDNTASNASYNDSASTLQLNGKPYQNAVAINLDGYSTSWSYQFPVPNFKHFTAPKAGLETGASRKQVYSLKIYKNNDGPHATVLYSGSFNGPSEIHRLDFDTQGATDLVFDWTGPASGEANNDGDEFIMADPVVTQS